jgi:hypothetical protein
MYLIIGDPQDEWGIHVRAALEATGRPARVVTSPFTQSARITLRLNNENVTSTLMCDDGLSVPSHEIAGVLVCNIPQRISGPGRPQDVSYIQAETEAALLAWLWSLDCTVINRYPSREWYRTEIPLLMWQPLLRRNGLPTAEMLVTNIRQEAISFRRRLADERVPAAVYWPLTSSIRYSIQTDDDWEKLFVMQRYTPVCIAYPHGPVHLVCVVGRRVMWQSDPPSPMVSLEPALRRCADDAGLAFVELALAEIGQQIAVIAIEPHPSFDHFDHACRDIVDEIAWLLTDASPTYVSRTGKLSDLR